MQELVHPPSYYAWIVLQFVDVPLHCCQGRPSGKTSRFEMAHGWRKIHCIDNSSRYRLRHAKGKSVAAKFVANHAGKLVLFQRTLS